MQSRPVFSRDEEPQSGARPLELQLDSFAWAALEQEAAQQGVSVRELATFALLYYLADVDSGRVSRQRPCGGRSLEPRYLASAGHRSGDRRRLAIDQLRPQRTPAAVVQPMDRALAASGARGDLGRRETGEVA